MSTKTDLIAWANRQDELRAILTADGYYLGTCKCGFNQHLHIGHTSQCADSHMLGAALR